MSRTNRGVEFDNDLHAIIVERAAALDLTLTSYVSAVLWGTVMAGSADSAALRAIDAGKVIVRRPPRAVEWEQVPEPGRRASIWRHGDFTVRKQGNNSAPWMLNGPGMRPMMLSRHRVEALREASHIVSVRAPAPVPAPDPPEEHTQPPSGQSGEPTMTTAGEGIPTSGSGSNGEAVTTPQPAGSGAEPGDSGPPSPTPRPSDGHYLPSRFPDQQGAEDGRL